MTANEMQATPLHMIVYWDSDDTATFETGRAHLLDILAQVAQQMDKTPMRLLLAGETALLGDVAAVRSDLLALLVIYNASSRLSLGPWYTQTDEWLVSGESLIRNLLAARADAARYGIKLLPVGYMPSAPGHVAQMPQILRGFDIDTAFVGRGAPMPRVPFRWEAPDGSGILAVNYLPGALELAGQQALEPDGPWLVMHTFGANHAEAVPHVQHSSLKTYVDALRKGLPDHLRPALRGEVRVPGDDLNTGTLSSRIYLKQANARLQSRLNFAAEMWLALALTHGSPAYPDNLRALLDHSWRMLLKNQARSALGGTSSDAAHDEHEIRARQIEDSSAHVTRESLRALFGEPYQAAQTAQETYVVVWNPHNWSVEQVVEVAFQPPQGLYPARLIDPEGNEKPFTWADNVLMFGANVPPVGYSAYTLHLSTQKRHDLAPARTRGTSISSALGDDKLLVDNERLMWRQVQPAVFDKEGQLVTAATETNTITDVLRFFDGGDAGDAFHFSAPTKDVITQANLLPDVEMETSPLYQRLIVHHRLRVTPALQPDRTRARGLKALDLITTATIYHHTDQSGIYFRTTFENSVEDHRLRAHLRTGLNAESVWADAAFALNKRQPGIIQPMQNLCAVESASKTVTLLARGLPEYEAIAEDGQITLALTLLRAFGSSGAQVKRALAAEYALVTLPETAGLLRTGQLYSAPLQATVCAQRPMTLSQSYLAIDGEGLIMTALKPPQTGSGWIVRLLNPGANPITAQLHLLKPVKSAHIVNLAEETQKTLDDVSVKIDPNKIVTMRLEF